MAFASGLDFRNKFKKLSEINLFKNINFSINAIKKG